MRGDERRVRRLGEDDEPRGGEPGLEPLERGKGEHDVAEGAHAHDQQARPRARSARRDVPRLDRHEAASCTGSGPGPMPVPAPADPPATAPSMSVRRV